MENSKPIFWHQGLFLQPQHFQLNEQYHRSLMAPYQQYMHGHFWGVANISLVSSALEHRSCEIESGQFMFHDGTFVSLPDDAVIKQRNFENAWIEQDKPFTIYLGLRKSSPYGDNVTIVNNLSSLPDVETRYVAPADPEEMRDSYQEGPVAKVKLMRHVLHIIWETEIESLEDFMLIPVARVVRSESGISYAKDFYPPVLSVNSSEILSRLVKEVRDELIGRMVQLSSYDMPGQDEKRYDATLMRYKLAARSLSRYIPRLFHIVESGVAHPWDVYGVFRELIGEISTFTTRVNVLGETVEGERLLPGYNHQDLGHCFSSAKELLVTLLNEITVGPQFIVGMPLKGRCFQADIPQEFFEKRVDFYLIVSTQSDFTEHQNSLLTTGKVSSQETVEILAERSLPGVGLIHVATPPADMPRRPDAHYVRLDNHDEQWPHIEHHRDIALLWEEAPKDAKIELVIVGR